LSILADLPPALKARTDPDGPRRYNKRFLFSILSTRSMRKLWLLFAQAVTLTLAVLFVVSLVKPDWLAWRAHVIEVRESAPGAIPVQAGTRPFSFSEAAKKAIPSVVNISATRQVKRRNPMLDDPAFQRFFGERFNLPMET